MHTRPWRHASRWWAVGVRLKYGKLDEFTRLCRRGTFAQDAPRWDSGGGLKMSLGECIGDDCTESSFHFLDTINRSKDEMLANPDYACGLFRSMLPFEALAGGILTTLPPWTFEELEEAKAVERDILGPEKAALAESLTDIEKVELRAAVRGIDFALRMVGHVVPEKPESCVKNTNGWYEANHEFTVWSRFAPDAVGTGRLPEKVQKLLFTTDAHPLLACAFVREAFVYYGGDYQKAKARAWDRLGSFVFDMGMGNKGPLLEQLDDVSIPIKDRLARLKQAKAETDIKNELCHKEYDERLLIEARKAKERRDESQATGKPRISEHAKRRKLLEKGRSQIEEEARVDKASGGA